MKNVTKYTKAVSLNIKRIIDYDCIMRRPATKCEIFIRFRWRYILLCNHQSGNINIRILCVIVFAGFYSISKLVFHER